VKALKATKQKDAILTAVRSMNNHPSADEIYRKLRESYPRLSLGTVYRNLNAFAEKGDIRKISTLEGGDRYDFRTDKHEHMLCENCGQVFDIEAEIDIKFKDAESAMDGHTLYGYIMILHGLCSTCRGRRYPNTFGGPQ
jgi:Fur family peroxide stress response transcriptional regulator